MSERFVGSIIPHIQGQIEAVRPEVLDVPESVKTAFSNAIIDLEAERYQKSNAITRSLIKLGRTLGIGATAIGVATGCIPLPSSNAAQLEYTEPEPTHTAKPSEPIDYYFTVSCRQESWSGLERKIKSSGDALWFLGQYHPDGGILSMSNPGNPDFSLIPIVCTEKEAALIRGQSIVLKGNPPAEKGARMVAGDLVKLIRSLQPTSTPNP